MRGRWPWARISGSARSAAGGRVCVGGDPGGGLFAELDVPAEAGQVLVAGFGLELGGGAAVSGQVLERGVSQLVKRPALLGPGTPSAGPNRQVDPELPKLALGDK